MNLLKNIVAIKNLERNNLQIIFWWELRRLLYNVFFVILIYVSLKILGIEFSKIEMGSGEYFILISLIVFLILTNFLYTFGWIIELFRRRSLTFAPRFFCFFSLITILMYCFYVGVIIYILR